MGGKLGTPLRRQCNPVLIVLLSSRVRASDRERGREFAPKAKTETIWKDGCRIGAGQREAGSKDSGGWGSGRGGK